MLRGTIDFHFAASFFFLSNQTGYRWIHEWKSKENDQKKRSHLVRVFWIFEILENFFKQF